MTLLNFSAGGEGGLWVTVRYIHTCTVGRNLERPGVIMLINLDQSGARETVLLIREGFFVSTEHR